MGREAGREGGRGRQGDTSRLEAGVSGGGTEGRRMVSRQREVGREGGRGRGRRGDTSRLEAGVSGGGRGQQDGESSGVDRSWEGTGKGKTGR